MTIPINIIFVKGTSGPNDLVFVEVETDDGVSINVGQWVDYPGEPELKKLRITSLPELADDDKHDWHPGARR